LQEKERSGKAGWGAEKKTSCASLEELKGTTKGVYGNLEGKGSRSQEWNKFECEQGLRVMKRLQGLEKKNGHQKKEGEKENRPP